MKNFAYILNRQSLTLSVSDDSENVHATVASKRKKDFIVASKENHAANAKIEDERLIAKTITPTQNFLCLSCHLSVIRCGSVSSCLYDNFSEMKK